MERVRIVEQNDGMASKRLAEAAWRAWPRLSPDWWRESLGETVGKVWAEVGGFGGEVGGKLADVGGMLAVHWGDYGGMLGLGVEVDGILLDLGISSDQLDDPVRGLTYQADGPLDMRMDPTTGLTVAELLNGWEEKDIAQVLFDYAEEPRARVLARAIVAARKVKPLATTMELLKIAEQVYPPRFGLKRSHPAGRIFQAFRMAVNGELQALERVLPGAAAMLKPGGRLVVITFHSLEERVVKRVFKELAVDELDCVGRVVKETPYKVWKKQVPGEAELAENPRARSAHVRVLERRA